MMKIHKVKGWLWGVIKSVRETSPGANRGTTKLSLNPGRGRTYNLISGKTRHIKWEYSKKKKRRDTENKESTSKSANVVEQDSKSGIGDMLSVSSSSGHLTDSWLLNSACSYHMTPNKDWLDTYKLVNSCSILIGNDNPCKVVWIGNIKIKMFDDAIRTLYDVRHIPNLRKNLISLGTLDRIGFSFKSEGGSTKGEWKCYDSNERTIFTSVAMLRKC